MNKEFSENLSFGQEGQDILINFLEKHFGYQFIAGERNGQYHNMDMIEEIEHCDFIYPKVGTGPKLKFAKGGNVVTVDCPDVFMRNSYGDFCWVEVKRRESSYPYVYINQKNFDSYEELYLNHTRISIMVMCLIPVDERLIYYDIYYSDMKAMIETKGKPVLKGRSPRYQWNLENGMMKKFNRYPIDIQKYK